MQQNCRNLFEHFGINFCTRLDHRVQLRHLRLDLCALRIQAEHAECVADFLQHLELGQQLTQVLRAGAYEDVEVVLDRNRHAVERPEQAAGSAPFIRCLCRCHGAVAVDGDEGVEAVLVVCDLDRVEGRADVIGDAHRCRVWLIVRPARLCSGVGVVEALHHVAEPGGLTP